MTSRRLACIICALACSSAPWARAQAREAACRTGSAGCACQARSEEHTSELQSRFDLVCRLLLEKKERAIVDRANLKRFVFFAGRFAIDLHFEGNVHRHLLRRLPEPIEFVVHLRRAELILAGFSQ